MESTLFEPKPRTVANFLDAARRCRAFREHSASWKHSLSFSGAVSIGLQMGDGAGFRTGGFRINGLVQGRRSWVEI